MTKTYNPSSYAQRVPIVVLGFFAMLVALYLAMYQWHVYPTVWDPIFGDGTKNVLTSPVSHKFTRWIRIPDASLGIFAYLSDVVFSIAGSRHRWIDRPWLVMLFGIAVIPGGLVSIILVMLQGIVVKSWCFLCLISALCSLILIYLAYKEVFASGHYLYQLRKMTDRRTTWWAFWGYPCNETIEATKRALNVAKNH